MSSIAFTYLGYRFSKALTPYVAPFVPHILIGIVAVAAVGAVIETIQEKIEEAN